MLSSSFSVKMPNSSFLFSRGAYYYGETPTLSKEELQAQLLAPTSLSVILVMICVLVMTLPHTFIVLFHKKGANYFSDNINFAVFQVSIMITGSIMASCTKLFPNSEGWLFWANIGLFAISFIICPIVNMCKNIFIKNIATFVAINAALTYLVSLEVNQSISIVFILKEEHYSWTNKEIA